MSLSNSSINGVTESASYTYDLQRRLVTPNQSTNSTSAQRCFVYDRWGNCSSVYDETRGGNQMQSVGLVQSSSITNNRIASVTQGGTTYTFSYDANDNLIFNTPFRQPLISVLIWYYNGLAGVKGKILQR